MENSSRWVNDPGVRKQQRSSNYSQSHGSGWNPSVPKKKFSKQRYVSKGTSARFWWNVLFPSTFSECSTSNHANKRHVDGCASFSLTCHIHAGRKQMLVVILFLNNQRAVLIKVFCFLGTEFEITPVYMRSLLPNFYYIASVSIPSIGFLCFPVK